MELSGDELAGVVDLFGVLTRAELERAVSELAFKRGTTTERPGDVIADAVDSYHLVALEDGDGTPRYAPGPAAFPELPPGAEDLPHILDVPERSADADSLATAAESQFRREAASAVAAGDHESIDRLLDVSYELEAWGDVDLVAVRERLDGATREQA